MSKILKIPGFPEQIGEFIEFPNLGEMMMYPQFGFAHADDFRKHASDFQKQLLDKAPITHKTKNVWVICNFRFLYPGVFANKPEFSERNEWHIDGVQYPSTVHIIMSQGSCRTEFNTTPFQMEVPDNAGYEWFLKEAIKREKEWGLNPKKVPAQQFITFSNHVHRASIPDKHEFRFFFRILETDAEAGQRGDPKKFIAPNISHVYQNVEPKFVPNIERTEEGFLIHYKD